MQTASAKISKQNPKGENLLNALTDKQLVARAAADDQAALEILVKRHLKLVYNVARSYVFARADTEDITQEVFVKIWKNLKKYRPEKSFTNWISEIAKNASLDWLKKKKTIPFSNFENERGENYLYDMIADPSPSPFELANQSGISETLAAAVARLSLPSREVFNLHDNRGLTFQEIADSSDQSINTVKSRYRRALLALKKILAGD